MVATFKKPNQAFWWVMGGTTLFLGAILIIPAFRDLFGFAAISPADLVICVVAGILSVVWFEVFKVIRGRRTTAHLP